MLFIALFYQSCYKDTLDQLQSIQGIQGAPQFSVPVINDHLGLKDIYAMYKSKGYIVEGSDNFLTFIYKSADTLPSHQYLSIQPASFSYNFALDAGAISLFNTIGTFTSSFSNYALLPVTNGERLKKINIKSGSFVMNITSTFRHNIKIVVTYPTLLKNGIALVDTIKLNYTGTLPVTTGNSIDLSGYELDLSNGGFSYNVVPYLFQISVTRIPGNPISVTDQLHFDNNVNVSTYNYLQGYLGKFNVLQYTADNTFDIFDKQADGNVFIYDPKVKVNIDNGIGMPITAQISNIRIITGKGNTYPVNVNKFKDTFTFDYPRFSLNQVGKIITSGFQVDKTNSNIDTLLSKAPQELMYDITYTANYNQVVDEDNFLFDKNYFVDNTNVELPMQIKVVDYYIHHSDILTLTAQDPKYTIDWYKMSSYFNNSMPIGALAQMYFCKKALINNIDSFIIVDSLYPAPIPISPAAVDANGKIISPSIVTNEATMNSERYDYLQKHCDKFLLSMHIRTSDYAGSLPFVKIYSNQSIIFKIGVEAKGRYKLTKQ
ncbi:MAG: hypothetical protein ACHQK8_03485 [Bacteroidia bacterium]